MGSRPGSRQRKKQRWPSSSGSPTGPRGSTGCCVGCAVAPKSPGPPIPRLTRRPKKPGKRGCALALKEAGLRSGEHLAWADEMRLGLVRVVRRVWAPVGVKVRQLVQQGPGVALPGGGHRDWGRTLVVVLDGEHGE
jgi:hypothetical protein